MRRRVTSVDVCLFGRPANPLHNHLIRIDAGWESRAVCGGAARLCRQGGVTSQLLILTLPVIPVFRKPILERPSRLPVIVTSI